MNHENHPNDERSARQEALDFARAEGEARRVSGGAPPAHRRPADAQKPRQAADPALQRKAAEPPAEPPKQKRRRPRCRWGCWAALVLVLLAALLAGGMLYVEKLETIFPNVTVNGTDLSGLSQKQAEEAVAAAGWDNPNTPVLTILFPGDEAFAVTVGDTGYAATAAEAAQAAWDYGRDGNAVTNLIAYLRARFSGAELREALSGEPDAEALRARVETELGEINRRLSEGSLDVDEDEKVFCVVKGAQCITIDPQDVMEEITAALREHRYETLRYPVEETELTGDIDMQALHDAVCTGPVEAGYDPETKTITESRIGIEFDVAEAQRLWDAAAPGETVRIPVKVTEPQLSSEGMTGDGLFADRLAAKTTSLSGSTYNRINNIKKAAAKIDGLILEPGESFSYNEAVGQRTKANGFLAAGAYANGQVVQEVGGGICQVSSTLYYCALTANLGITARTCHYFSVGYIEPGMDATVSWGAPDFRFKNDRTFPVRIHAFVEGNSLTVELWGTDADGSYVKMEYSVSGLTATTYRNVFDRDGSLLSRTKEATSTYHTHDKPKPKPEPPPSPEPPPEPAPEPSPESEQEETA